MTVLHILLTPKCVLLTVLLLNGANLKAQNLADATNVNDKLSLKQ